jgi:hypothetical protein
MNEFFKKDDYIDPADVNAGLNADPGIKKNLCELVVELISLERDKVLAGGDTIQYSKIIIPLFNKWAKPAPQTIKADPMDESSREELERIYANLTSRKAILDASIEAKNNDNS